MDFNHDALVVLFQKVEECPKNVFEFRKLVIKQNLKIQTTLVANRGLHNPGDGSFSLFEMVTGRIQGSSADDLDIDSSDFFFGHFTTPQDDTTLIADQEPRENALMVELIVWDDQKKFYNFYEMIGNGERGIWFYRGDSKDIQMDIRLLHRQPNSIRPVFGKRMRCSGCHLAGGPILKELSPPFNDWWQKDRKLPLGSRKPDSHLEGILSGLVSPERLSFAVNEGIKRLEESPHFRKENQILSLQENLRPLFCPVELNLASDQLPFDDPSPEVQIPTEFFMDPRLAIGQLKTSKVDYQNALLKVRSSFPETDRLDADHSWLTPVKAFSDQVAIEVMRAGQWVPELDQKFILSVLAVDFTNPIFSQKRCSLLKLVPSKMTPHWKEVLMKNLQTEIARPESILKDSAKELLANLTDPERTEEVFRGRGARFLSECQKKIDSKGISSFVNLLFQRRLDAQTSEISKNPLGKILEPGFRVIFPESNLHLRSNQWTLDKECEVVSQ